MRLRTRWHTDRESDAQEKKGNWGLKTKLFSLFYEEGYKPLNSVPKHTYLLLPTGNYSSYQPTN